MRLALAIGGNSLIRDSAHQRVEDQYARLLETCEHVARLADAGHRLVLTHGNGPQVGFILRRSELARHELHEVPLSSCIADTQGAIGFQIQEAMHTVQARHPVRCEVVTVVTQVIVDPEDPAFERPTKPISLPMDERTARRRANEDGWIVAPDGAGSWRRVVASPRPQSIVELAAIRQLVDAGFVVVAVGGGGIPVAQGPDGSLAAVDAVIDKDHASALLARHLGADRLVISTAVEHVCLGYGSPHERPLHHLSVLEAREYAEAGEFGTGSMLPKVLAAADFAEATGHEAVICSPSHLPEAVDGEAGTRIVP